MTTRQAQTKPVRIFANDDQSLGLVAGILNRSRADVFHSAWIEFLRTHREELASVFRETQEQIAHGDLDHLTRTAASALDAQIDDIVAGLPS